MKIEEVSDSELSSSDLATEGAGSDIHGFATVGASKTILRENETGKYGVVDTACNTSVVGEDIVQRITSHCDRHGLIWERLSSRQGTVFNWGGGKSSVTLSGLRFTALIDGRPFQIKADVVPGRMGLLLSLETLGRMGILADFARKLLLRRIGKSLVPVGKSILCPAGHMLLDLFQPGERKFSAFFTIRGSILEDDFSNIKPLCIGYVDRKLLMFLDVWESTKSENYGN